MHDDELVSIAATSTGLSGGLWFSVVGRRWKEEGSGQRTSWYMQEIIFLFQTAMELTPNPLSCFDVEANMFWLRLHGRMFVMWMYTLRISVRMTNVYPYKLSLCVRMSSPKKKKVAVYIWLCLCHMCQITLWSWAHTEIGHGITVLHKDTFHACVHTFHKTTISHSSSRNHCSFLTWEFRIYFPHLKVTSWSKSKSEQQKNPIPVVINRAVTRFFFLVNKRVACILKGNYCMCQPGC